MRIFFVAFSCVQTKNSVEIYLINKQYMFLIFFIVIIDFFD